MNDCDLLQGISRSEAKALEKLMDKYSRYVVAVIVHLSGDQLAYQDVEELCSDVFVKIWKCGSTLQLASETLKPYLAATAKNLTINRLKQNAARQWEEISENSCAAGADESEQIELKGTVKTAINSLQQPDRDLFVRRYFHQDTIRRLSEVFGLKPNTIATKLSRARKSLAKQLNERGNSV